MVQASSAWEMENAAGYFDVFDDGAGPPAFAGAFRFPPSAGFFVTSGTGSLVPANSFRAF